MADNGETKGLITLPPKWVSTQLLYACVLHDSDHDGVVRIFVSLSCELWVYLHYIRLINYIMRHNFSPTRSVIIHGIVLLLEAYEASKLLTRGIGSWSIGSSSSHHQWDIALLSWNFDYNVTLWHTSSTYTLMLMLHLPFQFSAKTTCRRDLVMACHSPPLKKAKKSKGNCHYPPSVPSHP